MPDAIAFLLNSIFYLVLYVLVIRWLLAFGYVTYLHPLTQTIDKLTRQVIVPLRRFIPNTGRSENATLVAIFIVKIIQLLLFSLIFRIFSPFDIILLSITGTIKLILQGFFFAILIQALLSWLQPGSPALGVISDITDPIMRPVRRIMPPIGGIDITPIPVLILIHFFILLFP